MISIILFFVIIKINFYKEIYCNPLDDFEESIFKILLLENNELYGEMPVGSGSGFVFKTVGNKSYIMTNDHICSNSHDKILIQNTESQYSETGMTAEIIRTDPEKDLCIIATANSLKPIRIDDSKEVFLGQDLMIIGAPGGFYPHISKVIVSDKEFEKKIISSIFSEMKLDYDTYLVSGDVFYGQSGSPILNDKGHVVGILFAKLGDNSGMIIRSKEIIDFINSTSF